MEKQFLSGWRSLLAVWCCSAATSVQAFVPSCLPPSTTSLHLQKRVEDAIADAQRICATDPLSQECKVAWDIVEELEAADSHRSSSRSNTEAAAGATGEMEYDTAALLMSFDLLAAKIDGKMDQLSATMNQFELMGADDPEIGNLGQRAQDMKDHIAYVKDYLNQYR
mmetsp:Transcript_27623/g.76028  ORF Transcript_27623/g.76028 Transcript_27623/m.76028 type:complete len:167 (+) Transcript_27623:99-599(+)